MTDENGDKPDWGWVEPPVISGNGNWEPTREELAGAPVLEHWSTVVEGLAVFLQGYVRGHPKLADGAFIRTSRLRWVSAGWVAAGTLSARSARAFVSSVRIPF